jgi:hypothetical protein
MKKTFCILVLLTVSVFSICNAADYVLWDASWPNAEKKWKQGRAAKNVKITKVTDPTLGDVVKIEGDNAKNCYIILDDSKNEERQGKLYSAIQVTYKYLLKPKNRTVLQFYMRNMTSKKTYRYATGIPVTLKLNDHKFTKFWKRGTSPLPVLSRLFNLLLELKAGEAGIMIKSIKLIETKAISK